MTARQRAILETHLGESGAAVERIAQAYRSAAWEFVDAGPWLRQRAKSDIEKSRRHFEEQEKLARDLIASLDWREPHDGMSELSSRAGYSLGWSALREHLAWLADVARQEAETHRRRRGRPSETGWRNKLINRVWDAYPPARATRTRGGHFEETIEMLLKWIGDEPEDVHDVVVAALGGEIRARHQAIWGT
jgi:hypothetical protein